jgi:hypothetical protein
MFPFSVNFIDTGSLSRKVWCVSCQLSDWLLDWSLLRGVAISSSSLSACFAASPALRTGHHSTAHFRTRIPCAGFGGKTFPPRSWLLLLTHECCSSYAWHQLNTHKLDSIPRYLVNDVFKIPRGVGSIPVGYARLACAFAISGLIHLLIDMSIGLTIKTSGGLSFFCTQILGIMLEDFVLVAYHQLRGYNQFHPSPAPPSTAQKFIGYLCLWFGPSPLTCTPWFR